MHYDAVSRRFSWTLGSVVVPPGYHQRNEAGSDSIVGSFTSRNGKIRIQNDIGTYAGAYANRSDAIEFGLIGPPRYRVYFARKSNSMAISMPYAGCANFFLYHPPAGAEAILREIAASYVPRDHDPRGKNPCLGSERESNNP